MEIELRERLREYAPIEVLIHGGCPGPDIWAARFVVDHDWCPHLQFKADWKRWGKAAGFMRNQQMLDEGKPDLVIAFWDGYSRGTLHMIQLATRAGVPVDVVGQKTSRAHRVSKVESADSTDEPTSGRN